MPPHVSADHPAAQPPGPGPVDALISQTRRLKGEVDAVRRDTPSDASGPRERWQRALCDLALHQLDDLDAHLAQLRDGPAPAPRSDAVLSRVGSAEWNLLTDEASWSGELYQILGRDPAAPPLTLDELPSLVHDEDRRRLTTMVTACLIDAQPIDGEFRIVRPDGQARTVHMMGEPVLDADGAAASMWAVLRDVSEVRRRRHTVGEIRDALPGTRRPAPGEHRLAAEVREAVLPPWRASLRPARQDPGTLDVAAHRLSSPASTPIGVNWYDSLELPDGAAVLSVGDLTGHDVAAASGTAALLGAVRGMAMAGTQPGQLLSWLGHLLDATAQPALGSAVCCRYRPDTRTLTWARAGHPAPLLFRGGTGRRLDSPCGPLLGAMPGAGYGDVEETLQAGDLILLHSDGLLSGNGDMDSSRRLLDLAPRFVEAGTAQDCVRLVAEEFGEREHKGDACVLVARVTA
ncbi:SpoIIE family protein phosphatase [Streptomyces sp. NPDC056628]|uniref:SpoIIE family protein phosphatase n=1 Tax=Streptomyces sp. NPDC056628 TaxID=3345882 RepID=UPI0036AD2225